MSLLAISTLLSQSFATQPRHDQAPLQKPHEEDAVPAEDAAAAAPEPEAQEAGDIADAAGSTSAPQDPKEKPQRCAPPRLL
jgi:hypothetical protein